MSEYDEYFQEFAEIVAAQLKKEDLLNMQSLSDPPYERVKEIIAACTRDLFVSALGVLTEG